MRQHRRGGIEVGAAEGASASASSSRPHCAICQSSSTCATSARTAPFASTGCAANFLDKLANAFPFKIAGIHLDGGSEFMADFEAACKAKASPSSCCRPNDPIFAHLYNHHRPHEALAGQAPAEYLKSHPATKAPTSHMS